MTNIIGLNRAQLPIHNDSNGRVVPFERQDKPSVQADKLAISDEATRRLEGLRAVDAPELHGLNDALAMAGQTVQMMLDRPEQARQAHVPDLGARVANLVA